MKKFTVIIIALVAIFAPSLSPAQSGTSTNQCTSIWSNLSVGDQDENQTGQVTALQNFLLEKGFFPVKPTGYFGMITKVAVEKFQIASGITSTGFVGTITRTTIEKTTCSQQTTIQASPTIPTTPLPVTSEIICPAGYTCTRNPAPPTSCPSGYICVYGVNKPPIESTVINQNITNINNTTHNTYIDDRTQAVVVVPVIAPRPTLPPPPVVVKPPPVVAPDPVPAPPPPDTSCPQSVTIESTKYSLNPCTITTSMVDGQGDKNFSTTIMAAGNYGFGRYGYGVGFPTYAILGVASGGASGNTTLDLHFNDSVLSADGDKPKIYSGYIPISVYQGSATGWNQHYMYLNLNLTVYPASSTPSVATTTGN